MSTTPLPPDLGDCESSPYGCCDDGLTSATGHNKQGCVIIFQTTTHFPKSTMFAESTMFDSTTKMETDVTASSSTPLTTAVTATVPSTEAIQAPKDFTIERTAVADDTVRVRLSWSPPDTEQLITSYEVRSVCLYLQKNKPGGL